jgi:hypothetical protein
MHDESAYDNLFGEDYPRKDDNIKLEETLGGEAEDTFAMVYFAERLPIVTDGLLPMWLYLKIG